MLGTRDIKRRIRSVQNTRQITRAMKMVAAAQLRKAQARALAARPYFQALEGILHQLAAEAGGYAADLHPLLQPREGRRRLYLVITSDRGLAGGYNANILRLLLEDAERYRWEGGEVSYMTLGRKGRDFLRFRHLAIRGEFLQADEPDYELARNVARELIGVYSAGEVDEVMLAYSQFVSVLVQRPTVQRFLPLTVSEPKGSGGEKKMAGSKGGAVPAPRAEYLFEPEARKVLGDLIPRYLNAVVYHAMLEAKAGEFGARMTAMDNATRNADDLIDTLTLSFNRARQAAITREIAEITGAAEALRHISG